MAATNGLDARLRAIALLVLDVDGVLTDGGLTFDAHGTEYKTFNVQDGYGLRSLKAAGVAIAIMTGRRSPMVEQRASELDIEHVLQGVIAKDVALLRLIDTLRLSREQVLYVGDDEPDMRAMNEAGVAVAVANAVPSVKAIADWVTECRGGEGAVREICDHLIRVRS